MGEISNERKETYSQKLELERVDSKETMQNYTQKSSFCKYPIENLSFQPFKNDASSSLLVNTEVCCPFPHKHQEKPKNRDSKELPSYVRKFVRKHTAAYCMTTDGEKKNDDPVLRKFATRLVSCNSKVNDFVMTDRVEIKEVHHESGKSRHIHGTIKCGSPWICPSCSATLSMTRGEQLRHIVECGREHGRQYGMAVLTVRHAPGESLQYLQDALFDIYRRARQGKKMRKFLEENNIRFVHRGYEIMGSVKGGKADWHPHFNLIFDYDKLEDMDELRKVRYELEVAKFLWNVFNYYAVKYYGIHLKEPFLEEVTKEYQGKDGSFYKTHMQVKGGVSFNLDFEEEYTTKFGLVEEATAGMYKNGYDSFHPFQILDMIQKEDETMSKKEKVLLISMFREYAKATKGKSFFRFGRGSVKFYQEKYGLQLEVLEDEAEILAQESKGEVFYTVPLKLWKMFNPNSYQVAVLLSLDTVEDMENYILQIINERLRE